GSVACRPDRGQGAGRPKQPHAETQHSSDAFDQRQVEQRRPPDVEVLLPKRPDLPLLEVLQQLLVTQSRDQLLLGVAHRAADPYPRYGQQEDGQDAGNDLRGGNGDMHGTTSFGGRSPTRAGRRKATPRWGHPTSEPLYHFNRESGGECARESEILRSRHWTGKGRIRTRSFRPLKLLLELL